VVAAVFNSGLLARPWPSDGAPSNYGAAPAEVLARARELARVREELGTTLPEAATSFGLRHPAGASVVVGAGPADHVTLAAQRVTTELPATTWQALDKVVAGWDAIFGLTCRFGMSLRRAVGDGGAEKDEERAKTRNEAKHPKCRSCWEYPRRWPGLSAFAQFEV
jgi:hypothetical protein